MSKKSVAVLDTPLDPASVEPMHEDTYKKQLHLLQIELVKLQRHSIDQGLRIQVIFEGRDAGGKDGTIKRLTEYLSPRETRVVALSKPSSREASQWYFQRWTPHLPAAGEMVLFNRSWYNRAGVERVMGFCTEHEADEFLDTVPQFEQMLIGADIHLFKFYLDISKSEQKKRLRERAENPLKRWKISPIDAVATKKWEKYSAARNEMFARTHTLISPWTVVRADDKRAARVNVIRSLLARMEYPDADRSLLIPNPNIVFPYDERYLQAGMIAP